MTDKSGVDIYTEIATTATPIRLRWNLSAQQLLDLTNHTIEKSRAVYDAVAQSVTSPSWEATMQPMINDEILTSVLESVATFPQHVSANKEIRDASTKCEELLSAFGVETGSRLDLYQAIQAYASKNDVLDHEKQRYLARTLRDFKRKGLHLDEAVRTKVLEINKRIAELGIQFSKNLGEENTKITMTKEQLLGMSDDFLSGLEKTEQGDFIVTLKYPHYLPIMKLCQVEATRQQLETLYNSRCIKENTPILEELVRIRHQKANLLGYPTHAAFITEIRMAKTPENVAKFLSDLSTKLTPLQTKELAVLLELKKEEKAANNQEFDGILHAWDTAYYRTKVEKTVYNVNHELIKQYFPLHVVTSGLLQIYQELLGLRFKQIDSVTWHEEVQTFEVRNASDDSLVGFFYLDLHPREGKYGHAACWGLQPSCELPGQQGRMLPVAGLVCNFSKATPGKPSLLEHDEVETFFHEFGHRCHQLCSLAKLPMFAGTAVERDFVEAPSQMLENWCWESAPLSRMSQHFESQQPMPDDLKATLIKSRIANAGIFNKRQITLATFDQTIHTQPEVDTAAVLAKITKEISGYDITPGTNMAASFGHLAGGYDAQYYGYLWSEVFSMDMFQSRFLKEGLFSPSVGADYRKFILAPGGSIDGDEMIRRFLGRGPTVDAFLKSKGLDA